MPLASCVRCKKIFNKTGAPVCDDCVPAEEADRKKVEELVKSDDSLTAEQVSEKADVELSVVIRMMDEGMVAVAAAGGTVTCGRCGAPAISTTKRLCQTCLDKLNAEVMQARSDIQSSKSSAKRVGNVLSEFHQKRRI